MITAISSFVISLILIEVFTRFKADESMFAWISADGSYWIKYHLLPSIFLAGTICSAQLFLEKKCPPYKSAIACQFDLSKMPADFKRQLQRAEVKVQSYFDQARTLTLKRKKVSIDCRQSPNSKDCLKFVSELASQIKFLRAQRKNLRNTLDQLYIKLEHENFEMSKDSDDLLKKVTLATGAFEQDVDYKDPNMELIDSL